MEQTNNAVARRKSSSGENGVYGVVSQSISKKFTFHLDTELGPSEDYRELSNILLDATEYDEVHLLINGPGGYLSTCAQLVNLIQNCAANVTGHLIGPSASAHTFIFLACPSWVVYPHSSLMLHSYSGGVYEKGRNILLSAQATQNFFEEFVQEIYYPFLTEEEVDLIVDGKDLHLHAKDIMPRLERLVAYRETVLASINEPTSVN